MPKPYHCMPYHLFLNQIQPSLIWIAMTMTDGTKDSDLVSQAEKGQCYIFPQRYKHITHSSIAYRMQISILFCCTETNNILRAVSSSEDAVLSIRTFTWF